MIHHWNSVAADESLTSANDPTPPATPDSALAPAAIALTAREPVGSVTRGQALLSSFGVSSFFRTTYHFSHSGQEC